MRRCSAKDRRQARRRGFCLLAVLVLTAGVLSLNRYVNTVVKPTLHELAEYEARSAAVQAMNRAVAAELTRSPGLRRPNLSAPCRPRWTLCRRSATPSRSAV